MGAPIKSRAAGVNRERLLMQHRCLKGEPNLSAETESWPHKGENRATPSDLHLSAPLHTSSPARQVDASWELSGKPSLTRIGEGSRSEK